MLLSSSCVFMFFCTATFSSVTSLICFILYILAFIWFHIVFLSCVSFQNWETAFTSPFFPRNNSTPSLAFFHARYFFYSLSLCFEYCEYKSNLEKVPLNNIRPNGAHYVIQPVSVCMSVLPLVISWPLCHSWTAWMISNKLGTRVKHFETMSTAYGSDGCLQGQCH